jgi:hypothetical protein
MERHGAAVMLARLAASDAALLRRATLETTDECSNQSVVALLLDAAMECCQGAHASVAAGAGDPARSRAHSPVVSRQRAWSSVGSTHSRSRRS